MLVLRKKSFQRWLLLKKHFVFEWPTTLRTKVTLIAGYGFARAHLKRANVDDIPLVARPFRRAKAAFRPPRDFPQHARQQRYR